MNSKFLGDILTDDTGKYFDLGAAVTFFIGIALIGLSAYDEYQTWNTYKEIVHHLLTVTPLPNLPPPPSFNAQNFGIAGGAVVAAFGGHKWCTKDKSSDNSERPGIV